MTENVQQSECFLVEWYQGAPTAVTAEEAAAHLSRAASESVPDTDPVALVMVLNVPHDGTLFAVFTSPGAEAVIHTCQRAGWPADRISNNVQPWLTTGTPCDGAPARQRGT